MSSTSDPSLQDFSITLPTLPNGIRALKEKNERDRQERETLQMELERQEPVIDTYRAIYERQSVPFGLDPDADDARLRGYGQRILRFGRVATAAGYADNVRALAFGIGRTRRARVEEELCISAASDLLVAGLSGNEDDVLRLLRECPRDEYWDVSFNDDAMLNRILDPQQRPMDFGSPPLSEPETQVATNSGENEATNAGQISQIVEQDTDMTATTQAIPIAEVDDDRTKSELARNRADHAELNKFAKDLPPLDDISGNWILARHAAKWLGIKTRTLANRRSKGFRAEVNGERSGVHDQHCCWRASGNQHPRYYLPRMHQNAGHLAKTFPRSTLLLGEPSS